MDAPFFSGVLSYHDNAGRTCVIEVKMKVKPTTQRGKVLLEVGPRDSSLLSEESLLHVQKILVPVDFSEASHKALRYAFAFAKQFRAEVVILHVTEIPVGTAEAGIIIAEGLIEGIQREAKDRLSGLMADARQQKVAADTLTRTGTPYHEIVAAAKEEEVDLVILSTRGRTGLRHLFLGSTAERVVRYAPCPVLVIREKERELIAEEPLEPERSEKRTRKTFREPLAVAPLPP